MLAEHDNILIVDESGFSRICSAILGAEGYKTEIADRYARDCSELKLSDFSLVITSYPNGRVVLEEISKDPLPAIILTDYICKDLVSLLKETDQSICLIKPIDYDKFRMLVNKLMNKTISIQGGYSIV